MLQPALTPISSPYHQNICALLTHDLGHLQTQFMGKDSQTYLKDKYLSTGGNLICTYSVGVSGRFVLYIR